MKPNSTIELSRFEEIALAIAKGYRASGTRFDASEGRGGRVWIRFADPSGKLSDLLSKHRLSGVDVNSCDYERGLSEAKRLVFAARER